MKIRTTICLLLSLGAGLHILAQGKPIRFGTDTTLEQLASKRGKPLTGSM